MLRICKRRCSFSGPQVSCRKTAAGWRKCPGRVRRLLPGPGPRKRRYSSSRLGRERRHKRLHRSREPGGRPGRGTGPHSLGGGQDARYICFREAAGTSQVSNGCPGWEPIWFPPPPWLPEPRRRDMPPAPRSPRQPPPQPGRPGLPLAWAMTAALPRGRCGSSPGSLGAPGAAGEDAEAVKVHEAGDHDFDKIPAPSVRTSWTRAFVRFPMVSKLRPMKPP